MFFFLSKTLGLLTQPIVIVGVLVAILLITKNQKWKKRLTVSAVVLFFLFSNHFISNEMLLLWELPPTPYSEMSKKYKYGVMLTGVTKSLTTGPRDRVYFGRAADRATHTLQLYKLGIIQNIVISGGVGKLIDVGHREAQDLKKFLIMCGVDSTRIILETTSASTAQSAAEIVRQFRGQDAQQFLLITSAVHMRRSLACFRKQGWQLDHFSADPGAHPRRFEVQELILPNIDAWMNWQMLLKECTGMVMYKLAGYI